MIHHKSKHSLLLALTAAFLLASPCLGQNAPAAPTKPAATAPAKPPAPPPDPYTNPMANPTDDPALPRVLIIGDSISIGYTAPVRTLLKGQANVHRPTMNCQHTGVGLASLPKWLGDKKWDVIHFNWGIWDTHLLDRKTGSLLHAADESKLNPDDVRVRHDEAQYRENLTKLVTTLKATGARLVFATTTPITTRKGERAETIARYNRVALEVMKENGVAVDDLHAFVAPEPGKYQGGDGCHFTTAGSAELAKLVSKSILDELARTKTTPAKQ